MLFGSHLGDFDAATVIHGKFTTVQNGSFEPFALAGGTLVVYGPGNGTTEVTGGTIVLTADFDGRTGLNHYSVDTTGYAAGFYQVVLSAGTVDSTTRVGNVVGSFTIRATSALKPTTAGRTLVVDAAGLADANAVKMGPTGAGTAQAARDLGTSVLLSNGTGTGQIVLNSGRVAPSDYAEGAIWLDTNVGVGGTTVNVNGIASNPAGSIADVTTLLASTKLSRIHVANGSSVALEAAHEKQDFLGTEWTLTLNSQSIRDSRFEGATVGGIATASGGRATFVDCHMEGCTLPACNIEHSGIKGTVTCSSADVYNIVRCYSVVPIIGFSDPTIDLGSAIGTTIVNVRQWAGGIQVANLKTGDIIEFGGTGKVTLLSSCTGGTCRIRGNFVLVNQSSGVTLEDSARFDEDQSLALVTSLTNLPAITTDWLTATGIASDAANEIADALLDRSGAIETAITPRLALRYIGAAVAGKVSGAQTATEVFTGLAVATTRITVTADSSGNRSAVVYA